MIRHDLRLVRLRPEDQSLHCETHGLLPDDEARDVFERAKLTAVEAHGVYQRRPRLARTLDKLVHVLNRLSPPKCVVLS